MKITKKGKIPSEELSSECSKCGTEFAFNKNEAHSSDYDQRDNITVYRVSCPLCSMECYGYD